MNTKEKIKPTAEWISEKYAEMNSLLFNGKLGQCNFGVFTSGKGKERALGHFFMNRHGLKVESRSGRIFFYDSYGDKVYINHNNFFNECNPTIELNWNFSATEDGWLNTLVHEMCHYYTYMDGICPKQAHGTEFRRIASIIAARSDGKYKIERIASSEKRKNFELDAGIAAQQQKRIENAAKNAIAIFVFKTNGDVLLTLTKKQEIVYRAIAYWCKQYANELKKIIVSTDSSLLQTVMSKGFKSMAVKNVSFWTKPALDGYGIQNIADYQTETVYPRTVAESVLHPYSITNILEQVIEGHMKKMFDDDIDITPNMNLGLVSPLESLD